MAAHARLKNEFSEEEKSHNLMIWLIYIFIDDDWNGLFYCASLFCIFVFLELVLEPIKQQMSFDFIHTSVAFSCKHFTLPLQDAGYGLLIFFNVLHLQHFETRTKCRWVAFWFHVLQQFKQVWQIGAEQKLYTAFKM